MLDNTTVRHVLLLLFLAFFLRIFNFSFPTFTSDEARIAFRGYTLSTNGVDEIGRKLPYLFNSQEDYQLPLTSYVSVLGAGIFGKSELGARAPFIIMGLLLVVLTYKVSTQISKERFFQVLSAFLVTASPALIFVSKVPNDPIILTTLFLLLFYLLNKEKINLIFIVATIILLLFTSKFSWFILIPFVIYTVFIYRDTLGIKDKLKPSLISFVLVTIVLVSFLQIPQGIRSLSENNLSLFSDTGIKNGINRIRGQGLKSGWQPILEQILINKAQFILVGSLHWLSNIQPAVLFSEFDRDGNVGFMDMGAFPKVAIIPFLLGLMVIVRERKSKLLMYPVIITLPAALIYPRLSPQIVILALPFMAYVIAFGLHKINKLFFGLIISFMFIELLINFLFLSPQVKMRDELRPYWIKPIVQDVYKFSNTGQIFISDDVTKDPTPFIEWYTPFNSKVFSPDFPYPYKISQTNLGRIKLIGFSDSFKECDQKEIAKLFVTKRDLDRVRKMSAGNIIRTYLDNNSKVIIYFVEESVCLN